MHALARADDELRTITRELFQRWNRIVLDPGVILTPCNATGRHVPGRLLYNCRNVNPVLDHLPEFSRPGLNLCLFPYQGTYAAGRQGLTGANSCW